MKKIFYSLSLVLVMVMAGFLSSAQALDDFGDAMEPPYPTLLGSGGAQHLPGPFFLGAFVDYEPDGQPSPLADGDDLDLFFPSLGDDEDGVAFTSLLIPGGMASVSVTASLPGFLNAWVDFNGNGNWGDPGDQIFLDFPLVAGVNLLPAFPVPPLPVSTLGQTYARFRFCSAPGFTFFAGLSPDGEVEDELVTIGTLPLDFGDAPDPTYPTILASNGARHTIVPGFNLGPMIDSEPDGQPSAAADGDDLDLFFPSLGDDEDGVVFTSPLARGNSANVDVTASAPGLLCAWVDFNINGSWADPGEQIFIDLPIAAGLNMLGFLVPPGATPGWTYARFRFSSTPGLAEFGMASDGEVEDEYVEIVLLPPVADAGAAEYTASSGQVTLDGSGSYDADGIIMSWAWDLAHQTDPANNTTASGQTPTVSGLAKGTYDVTLTVTDNDALIDTDDTIVKNCFISSLMR